MGGAITLDVQVGRRIRELRTLAGLSARELSRLAGLPSQSHVSSLELSEGCTVQVSTIVAIAEVLGCSLDWLIVGRGKPPPLRTVRSAIARARRPAHRAA
jgi:transcriptional regulator with XRE-family HTH domain